MISEPATNHSSPATDADEVLVRVEGVSKKFCRSLKRSLWYGICDIGAELNPFRRQVAEVTGDGLLVAGNGRKQNASELATSNSQRVTSPPLRPGEFWAVNDVSIELRRGECLGLIGHNGAGKTTLLKMLNGLIKPDTGRIEMNGRVGALIALGSGFNPVLTGRENIYINGSVLGLSKREIDEKMDEIIDFAEIEEFIDMPVQNYSSGMAVRLGFSVASSLNPDLLILDEVLAVGDMRFVVKCLNRLREMATKAGVILVSHNMPMVSAFCTRVLVMESGKLLHGASEPSRAIDLYNQLAEHKVTVAGSGGVVIRNCKVRAPTGSEELSCPGSEIQQGANGEVLLEFEVEQLPSGTVLQINITDSSGSPLIAVPVLDLSGGRKIYLSGRYSVGVPVGVVDLNAGTYSCTAIFRCPQTSKVFNRTEGLGSFRVVSDLTHGAKIVRPAMLHG